MRLVDDSTLVLYQLYPFALQRGEVTNLEKSEHQSSSKRRHSSTCHQGKVLHLLYFVTHTQSMHVLVFVSVFMLQMWRLFCHQSSLTTAISASKTSHRVEMEGASFHQLSHGPMLLHARLPNRTRCFILRYSWQSVIMMMRTKASA